ncbi:MAG: hypothetical protein MJ232_02180 [archaeon]|nr:hypothetical protein [archaeon]
MNLIISLILATFISFLNFVIVDTYLGLPEEPGVKGAMNIGQSIKKRGGDLSGGFFQGNILCSPDASAGTLIAAIGVYVLGLEGGLIAAFLVFIGNRLCADPGYAGTIGALTMTALVIIFSFIGISAEMFIVGIIIAIFLVQGVHHPTSTKILGKIAKVFGRDTQLE